MSRSWNRTETWLGLGVLGIAAIVMAIFGLNVYMSATATPLHPDATSVPSVAGADPTASWREAVDRSREVMRSGLAEQNLPALSVAVGVGNELVWAEGFGFANLEGRNPVTPQHRFRIGTASNVLTSAAVGLLMEQGRVQLDEPIQSYVPEFPKKAWPVTLRQLMGHVAGLRSDRGDEGPLFEHECERPIDALPHFADSELLFEPGTQYRFSAYGFIVVSAAVEAGAKVPFLTFMQEQIFDPLGMRDTRADSATRALADRVTPYFPRFSGDPRYGPDLMRDLNLSCYAGASVFLSTPSDLVRFALALRNGNLLKPDTVQMLQTPLRLPSGEETGYGLGWDLETVSLLGEQKTVVGHDGDVLGGRVGSLMMFRDRDMVVAVLANESYADTQSLATKVAEAFAAAHRASGPGL